MGSYRSPIHEFKFEKRLEGKKFTEDDDRYLLCKLYAIGMDNENVYNEIRDNIR